MLHVAELSFQQIGRIRDAQIGKMRVGKQLWYIPFQAVVLRCTDAYACSVSGLFSRSRCVRSGRRRTYCSYLRLSATSNAA